MIKKIFLPKNWRCFVQNTVTFVQNLNENIIVFKTNTIFFQKLPKIVIITLTPGSNQTVAAFYIQLQPRHCGKQGFFQSRKNYFILKNALGYLSRCGVL
jgi:hypothetical protein